LRSPPLNRWYRASGFWREGALKANGTSQRRSTTLARDAVAAIRRFPAATSGRGLLSAFLSHPVHEIAAVERLTRELSASAFPARADVLPQIEEYERVSTTIVNAYVGPLVRHYLTNLEQRLAEAGFKAACSSSCRMVAWRRRGSLAPCAGTVLSDRRRRFRRAAICAICSASRSVPFDMAVPARHLAISEGSASLSRTECSRGNALACAASTSPASRPAADPSPASMPADASRRSESAGSVPGPACYGNGGLAATVTTPMSSRLSRRRRVHGRTAPARFGCAEAAVDQVAASLGLSRLQTAAGIYRMINLKMADGIRLMTLRRGVDPRRFSLLSFGGAAGLHAAEVARELDISASSCRTARVGVVAWGMLTSDLRYEVSRTHYGAARAFRRPRCVRVCSLEQQAAGRLRAWFDGPMTIARSAEMRYGSRYSRLTLRSMTSTGMPASLVDDIEDRFHRRARRALHLCPRRRTSDRVVTRRR